MTHCGITINLMDCYMLEKFYIYTKVKYKNHFKK